MFFHVPKSTRLTVQHIGLFLHSYFHVPQNVRRVGSWRYGDDLFTVGGEIIRAHAPPLDISASARYKAIFLCRLVVPGTVKSKRVSRGGTGSASGHSAANIFEYCSRRFSNTFRMKKIFSTSNPASPLAYHFFSPRPVNVEKLGREKKKPRVKLVW